MVVLSKLGETEEAVGFSGKSKSSGCHLDLHLETVGMEYTMCDWELSQNKDVLILNVTSPAPYIIAPCRIS